MRIDDDDINTEMQNLYKQVENVAYRLCLMGNQYQFRNICFQTVKVMNTGSI